MYQVIHRMSIIKGTTLLVFDMPLPVFIKFIIYICTFVGAAALPTAKLQMYRIGYSDRANTCYLRRTPYSFCLIHDTRRINMNETALDNTVDALVLQSQRYKRWMREVEWKSGFVVQR
jgi:hypothetical protein